MIYLAIPYKFNPKESFKIVNRVTASLIKDGNTIFSPISQGHVVANYLPEETRTDSNFWLNVFLPILDKCDEMYIVNICDKSVVSDGLLAVQESEGCQAEIKRAKELGLKITYIDYE